MYSYKTFSLNEYQLSYKQELIELFIYSLLSFFIPFILSHPQLLVGTIVNSALVLAALNLRGIRLLPVIMLPSLAVLSSGLIFGQFTYYLLYLIPAIWLRNSLLVWSFKHFKLEKGLNYGFSLVIGAILKSLFLFAVAYLLYFLHIIPVIFLAAMGLIQLTTALSGGIVAFVVHKAKKQLF